MAMQCVNLDIDATVEARPVREDYGVPGSPVWTSYEDPRVVDLNIGGVDLSDRAKRVEALGEKGAAWIEDLVCECVEDRAWEAA